MSLVYVDTSVWARVGQPLVAEALSEAISVGSVVMTRLLMLELLRSARDPAEHRALREEYESLHGLELTAEHLERAVEVQALLARRGYHRGPSPVDLISAAAAESVGAVLWHCDRDFELIAEVTRQPLRRLGR
ncbi:MAG: PIN domain-containing protein [Myxococcota bacterium]